jgi:small subunit ribosomal protein S16
MVIWQNSRGASSIRHNTAPGTPFLRAKLLPRTPEQGIIFDYPNMPNYFINACCSVAKRAIICGFFRPSTIFGNIMVVIRLARGGAKKRPFFNIVATDSRNRRDGRFIERIGFYNPMASGQEVGLRITEDRLAHWQSVGAQLSPTVARLVAQNKKAA